MPKSFESKIPQPTPEDIESIIKHSKEKEPATEEDLDLRNLPNQELDEFIIDSASLRPGDAIMRPPRFSERMRELRGKDFSEASNWNELYAIIASKGEIVMAGQKHTAKEVMDLVRQVKSGQMQPEFLTRRGGLRDKVIELMESGS